MKMTRSREILAVILQCVMAVCTAVLIFSFVLNFTFASSGYIASRFPCDEVAAQCDEQLTEKYTALAERSGFPVRVFEMVKENIPTVSSVKSSVKGLVEGNSVDFYNKNQIDFFYNLCEEYAKGNNIDYTKGEVLATAQEAAHIYSDTVGIKSAESASQKISELKHKVTFAQFVSTLLLVFCGVATVLMYSRKRLGYCKLLSATAAGGIGVLFSSAMLYIIKPAQHLKISPDVYALGFSNMTGKYFFITAIIAVAVIAVSYVIMIQQQRSYIKSKDKVKVT